MKEIYLVIGYIDSPEYSTLGESIRANTGAASNFKAAYNAALSIGEISKPNIGYKQALERLKREGSITLVDSVGTGKVTIVKIKKY